MDAEEILQREECSNTRKRGEREIRKKKRREKREKDIIRWKKKNGTKG